MPPPPKPRRTTSEDLPALLELFWASSEPMYTRLGATKEEIGREHAKDWAAYWRRQVAAGRALITADGEGVTGMLGLTQEAPSRVGFVSIYTRTPGQGIGSALMEAALTEAATLGATQVELSTGVANVEMRALAEKYGFAPAEHYRPLNFPSLDFIRYAREL